MATKLLKSSFCVNLYMDYTISQSVANNTSTIALTMYLVTQNGYNIGPWSDHNGSYIGTTSKTFDGYIPNFQGTRTLATTTITVNHNSDGTGSTTIYWKWGVNSPWGEYVNPSGSFKIDLQTIPRATTPTLTFADDTYHKMGTNVKIGLPRASTAFTHDLYYSFNGSAEVKIGSGYTTSHDWVLPKAMANSIPDNVNGTGYVKVITYNGSTKIGTKSVNFTSRISDDMIPSILAVKLSDANTSVANKIKAFVKNKSQLKVEITANGSYSSTVQTYATTFLNIKYTGMSFTTGIISSKGALTVKVTVTDSRGQSNSVTETINVLDYYNPQVKSFDAYRCDDNGNPYEDGTRLKIEYDFDICDLNNMNDKSYKIVFKKSDDESYQTLKTGSVYKLKDSFITGAIVGTDYLYEVGLIVTDFFNPDGLNLPIDISSSFSLIDCNASGKGISFGEASLEDNFNVAMDARFKKPVVFDQDIDVPDTGWIELTLTENFIQNDATLVPKYRRIGKMVEIKGQVNPTISGTGSTSALTIANLPPEIVPNISIYTIQPASNKNTWVCHISNTNKAIMMSRYGTSDFGTYGPNTWLPFHFFYFID